MYLQIENSSTTAVNWKSEGAEVKQFVTGRMRQMFGNENYEFWISNESFYGISGITWSLRAERFSPRVMPAQSIFSVRGYSAFVSKGFELSSLALMNSEAFDYIFKTALGRFGFPEFIVGTLQKLPWNLGGDEEVLVLERLAHRAWSLKRTLDTIEETSHAFLLPAALRPRISDYDPPAIEEELVRIQAEIDEIAFDLYGLSDTDCTTVKMSMESNGKVSAKHLVEEQEEESELSANNQSALRSWAVGVAFGRFDWRFSTGERQRPPEPEPFDPLPAKSPGMLPDNAEPFHLNGGILADDLGHQHDLTRLIESVLERVEVPVPPGIRRWLQRDFFPEHLKQYSKSRRKAPIYWPLSTTSGGYTLWVYYPSLTGQTLYIAVNDFVEPKLKSVAQIVQSLRIKPNRSREEEKELEQAQDFELELTELRDTLLEIAKGYKPNHDDGVQITAAPLWPLFRHKPWQKVLKDTWKKLEKGDYDWAHLAMSYWPDRVREKCRTDKSLAIAHGLEDVFEGNT
jgi:hypothetical protein